MEVEVEVEVGGGRGGQKCYGDRPGPGTAVVSSHLPARSGPALTAQLNSTRNKVLAASRGFIHKGKCQEDL